MGTLCRSSHASFITKFSLVIKGNGAVKVRDQQCKVFPHLRATQNADAVGFPTYSSVRLRVWGLTVPRDGHTGRRRRQGKDIWWLDWMCFCLSEKVLWQSSSSFVYLPSWFFRLIFLPSATLNNSLLGYMTWSGLLWLAPALLLVHSHLIPSGLGTGVSCQQQ